MQNIDITFNDNDVIKQMIINLRKKYQFSNRYSNKNLKIIYQAINDSSNNLFEKCLLKSILKNKTMAIDKLAKLTQFPIYSLSISDITNDVKTFKNVQMLTKISFDNDFGKLRLNVVTMLNDKTNINKLINQMLNKINIFKEYFKIFANSNEIFFSLQNNKLLNNSLNRVFIYVLKNMNKNWSKSPYSNSFYNSKNIQFGYKPEGSIRISNHWNFGKDHQECPIANIQDYNEGWKLCRYHNGKYYLIKDFEK